MVEWTDTAQNPSRDEVPTVVEGWAIRIIGSSSAFQSPGTTLSLILCPCAHTCAGNAPRMGKDAQQGLDWAGLPVIATLAQVPSAIHDAAPGHDSTPRGQPEPGVHTTIGNYACAVGSFTSVSTCADKVGSEILECPSPPLELAADTPPRPTRDGTPDSDPT